MKNAAVSITWRGKEDLPTCDFCGEKMSAKQVKTRVDSISTGKFKIQEVQRRGEYRQEKAKLYRKIKEGKLSCEEAFRLEKELDGQFLSGKMVDSTEYYAAITCPNCNSKMGSLHIRAQAIPRESAERPSTEDYFRLKKSPSTLRYLYETFRIPRNLSLEDWIAGRDQKETIKKLKTAYEELKTVSGMSNASRGIFKDWKALESEVKERPAKVYAELKEPGLSTYTTIDGEVMKLHDEGLSEKEIVEKLGARPSIVAWIIKEHEKGREIAEKAQTGEYAREREERRRREEAKWR